MICGLAAAASIAGGTGPAGQTITVTVPQVPTTTTIRVKPTPTTTALSPTDAAQLQAAYADPSRIASVAEPKMRALLAAELASLDAFIAPRPTMHPYLRDIWYVAHHAHPPLSPRRLAALLWCTVWFPHDCG